MSGIKNIQQKAKMQMDEMYSAAIERGKTQEQGIQQAVKMDAPTTTRPVNEPMNSGEKHATTHSLPDTSAPQLFAAVESYLGAQTHESRSVSAHPVRKDQKPSMYKMTFNLTESSYKAFNDLYAHRMLQGRKTEKSELICEAIQLLTAAEEGS